MMHFIFKNYCSPLRLATLLLTVLTMTLSPLTSTAVNAEGTYSGISTADGVDGSNDAINFSQGRVWTIDQYGKFIWLTQTRNGPSSHWTWSNTEGSTWTQGNESYSFLTRGSVAYDSKNDVLHVIWAAMDSSASGGIIYRRYGINRDVNNDITNIVRIDSGTVNLQLDYTDSSRLVEQPVALWVDDGSSDGMLIAIWLKNGSNLAEIRGSMRRLSMDASDGVAGNWEALDGLADVFAIDPPQVPADKIHAGTAGTVAASASVRGGTGSKKNDLYVFVANTQNSEIVSYRGIWNSGSTNWSGGYTAALPIGSMNVTAGYSLKEQLLTKPVLDPATDRLYVGWARWKNITDGDTVSVAYLDSNDSPSATFDVYSALGQHSYAPTIDIAFDETQSLLYVAYLESTTNGGNGNISYKTFNGSTLSSATRFYTSPGGSGGENGSADIPILYESRYNNKLLFAFRVNGAVPPTALEPHSIYWGYETLPVPENSPAPSASPEATSSPTVTPAPSQQSSTTASNNQEQSQNGGHAQPTACTSIRPAGEPDLFQINTTARAATIYFSPITSTTDRYFVAYGLSPNDNQYGTEIIGTSTGVLAYTLGSLSPNTTYYIKVRGGNGCMPGEWSNEMTFTTSPTESAQKTYYKNFIARFTRLFSGKPQVLGAGTTDNATALPSACEHIVQSGDSLWKIALQHLGTGARYQEIATMNQADYQTLSNPSLLRVGWKLALPCEQ